MKSKTALLLIFIVMMFALSACFAEGNPMEKVPDDLGETAGFLKGLWHGIIAPFTFFVSLFTDGIHMYEVHNNGGWYNFGFVIGAGIIFSGSGRASRFKKSSG
jgi:hypothetical protein